MKKLIPLALAVCFSILASVQSKSAAKDEFEDLKPEASRRRIYEIIQSHEDRKYGDHGGHEYEEGEIPLKLASRKQYGYLPAPVEGKAPIYYDAAPQLNHYPKDNVYRENVAAYAPRKPSPVHLSNAPQHVIASPVSHSHYAIVDPKTHNSQYVTLGDPKPYHKRPLILDPKASYILEEEPHYVHHGAHAKPPAVSYVPQYHQPVKSHAHYDKHHHALDKGHHSSGHGYHGDNSVHEESGHKSNKHYEVAGHKEHASKGGHHDEHDHHHNRAHYERDRGYHYEKAYAYDRVRAHHDIGSDKGSHSDYHANHGHEGHKKAGDHGSHSYLYFKKNDHHGEHGHHDKNSLYKGGHHHAGGQGYHDYELKYPPPHHHAYGK